MRLSHENTLHINISNNLDAQQTDSQLNNKITLEPYERKRIQKNLTQIEREEMVHETRKENINSC